LDDLRRCNDVELIRTRGRRARFWEPLPEWLFGEKLAPLDWSKVFPLESANRLALWRLAGIEREDINQGWWNQGLIAQPRIAEKKERWRKRKSDVRGLWDTISQFWHPPVPPNEDESAAAVRPHRQRSDCACCGAF